MDWDEKYRKGEAFWDKGVQAPAMKQYLARHAMHGRALVPGCGRGHEVALAVEHRLDARGLDIAPTEVAEVRVLRRATGNYVLSSFWFISSIWLVWCDERARPASPDDPRSLLAELSAHAPLALPHFPHTARNQTDSAGVTAWGVLR